MGEAEPLFVYGDLNLIQLIDSTTVLLGDNASVRLVYADLVTGEGWAVGGSRDGPGELGRQPPQFSASGGLGYTAAYNLQGATWSDEGDLLEAARYPESFLGVGQFPMGVMRSGVVVSYRAELLSARLHP